MANHRAIVQTFPDCQPESDTSYSMALRFRVMPRNLSGEFLDIDVKVSVLEGDSGTVVRNKIMAALQTAVDKRQPGDVVGVIQGLDLARWL